MVNYARRRTKSIAYKFIQKPITFTFLPILLIGWVGGASPLDNNPTASPNVVKLAQAAAAADNSSSIFSVGRTYDSMSGHPTNTNTCLKAGTDTNNLQIDNPHASLNFGSAIDSNMVQNALGVDYTATFGWGAFAVTTSYQYAKSTIDNDFTMNINYAYQYTGKASFKPGVLIQGNDALIPEAQSLLTSDPVGFRTMCGDGFVNQVNAGASLLMRISLKFNSHNEKNSFDSSFNEAGGLAKILSVIHNNPSGIHYSLSVAGIQVGGNPEQLNNLFKTYGGKIGKDGYPVLECGDGSITNGIKSNCTDIINQVLNYTSTISGQLKQINDYHFYNPTIEQWSGLGVHPGVVNPDPDTLQAMRDLATQFNHDHDNLIFLNNYYHMLKSYNLLSQQMSSDLLSLINKYELVIGTYHNPDNMIDNCYNGYVSTECINIRNNIFKQHSAILHDNYLNTLLSYLQQRQYNSDLRINNTPSATKINCQLSPISDEALSQYLVNCGGYISGSTDPAKAMTIQYNPINNLVNIHNFNYAYPVLPGSELLHFSYGITDALFEDNYYPDVWSNIFAVQLNGLDLGMDELTVVRDLY